NGRFTVSQSAPSSSDTQITYSVGGTATSGSDFAAHSGTVTIPAGQTSATIDVAVVNDTAVEGTETVVVTLTAISSGNTQVSINPAQNSATLDIQDNDSATIAFVLAPSTAVETSGSHTVAVRLSIPSAGTLARPVTVNVVDTGTGTATAADFTLNTTSITF